ncbi:MAG: SulP family inorganic anion transporter [Gammaproteobacteria bacterium]|jgi:MFS superfamily sulfate permease-like transporter|nr:SulP family inorganic anion transporter [Gammaproteobacteria bacterium]
MNSSTKSGGGVLADIKSGFLVFLIALPLCLGIASASGFPPIAGLTTAIVGGLLVSWMGGAALSIKGPAAGLIVIALGAVTELGAGDMMLGYQRALAVGVVASLVQMLFARFKMANLGIAMSKSVVHGMLAAIGLIIIAKQIHVGLGVKPHGGETLELLEEIPHSIMHANPEVALICALSLVILFLWPKLPIAALRKTPPQLVVLAAAIPAAIGLGITEPSYFVSLPDSLVDGFAFPDFSVVTSMTSIKYIIMFALVGSIESTLSVVAVDGMVKDKPRSDLNRDLMGVSIGNFLSSMLGGLPMISEIVRSKANIDAEATSHRSNFFHGLFLLLFVIAVPGLLKMIPMAALAAMLILTGSRLASIKEFIHAKHVGVDQFLLFLSTFLITIFTDLLIGVAAGLLLKILFHILRGSTLKSLFGVQVEKIERGDDIVLVVHGDAAFPSLLKINAEISHIAPEDLSRIKIDLSEARLIDHTFLSGLGTLINNYVNPKDAIFGIEEFRSFSQHPEATHLSIKPQ